MKNFMMALGFAGVLSGCIGMDKAEDATLAQYGLAQGSGGVAACGSTGGLAAFTAGTFVNLRANCASCHATSTSPLFALTAANAAYEATRPYVNFAVPIDSLLYRRAIDGHCGEVGCRQSGREFLATLQTWATAESSSVACAPSEPSLANSGVAIRTNGTLIQQNFSTSQPAMACVAYELAYVRDGVAVVPPRDVAVALSGVATYSDSTCRTAAPTIPIFGPGSSAGPAGQRYHDFYVMAPVASQVTLRGSIAGHGVSFAIQLSVTAVGAPPSPTPVGVPTPCSSLQRQNAYAQTVWPLAQNRCATCHTTGNRPRFGSPVITTAYPIARGLVNIANAAGSRLYTKSRDGHCGNCNAGTWMEFLTQMNLWLPAENTNNCSALTTPK